MSEAAGLGQKGMEEARGLGTFHFSIEFSPWMDVFDPGHVAAISI